MMIGSGIPISHSRIPLPTDLSTCRFGGVITVRRTLRFLSLDAPIRDQIEQERISALPVRQSSLTRDTTCRW
jgi:hypothetical protein